MSDYKFGHRVLVFNNKEQKWEKGQYIKFSDAYTPHLHHVLLQESKCVEAFTKCRLDPEATEFLPGDEVEVRDSDEQQWSKAIYAGCVQENNRIHYAKEINVGIVTFFNQCRYPQPAEAPEPAQTIELNGKRYEIREVQE